MANETFCGRPVRIFETTADAELVAGEHGSELADKLYGRPASRKLEKGTDEAREHMAKVRAKRKTPTKRKKSTKQDKADTEVENADETKPDDTGTADD